MCVDINKQANQITKRTGDANGVHLSAVTSNLLQGLEARLSGKIDVLLFNPPYVPTTAEEEEQAQQLERSVQGSQISAAWAGGSMGIRLLTMLLEGSGSCSTPIEVKTTTANGIATPTLMCALSDSSCAWRSLLRCCD